MPRVGSSELLVAKFIEALDSASAEDRYRVVREFLRGIDDPDDRQYIETIYNTRSSLPALDERVVILIHGIRTHAVWQELIKTKLDNQTTLRVYPVGYDYYDIFNFLLTPLTSLFAKRKVLREIRNIRADHPMAHMVVVAHSFGTYLMSKILMKNSDVRLRGLLLCGSIIPTRYRWDLIPHFPGDGVINDCGTKDNLPVLAKIVNGSFGYSGTFGFKTGKVTDRYHNFGHSDFFSEEFIDQYWVPFITQGSCVPSTWSWQRPNPHWIISFLSLLSVEKLLFFAVLAYWLS